MRKRDENKGIVGTGIREVRGRGDVSYKGERRERKGNEGEGSKRL